jgi:hypothetical protein
MGRPNASLGLILRINLRTQIPFWGNAFSRSFGSRRCSGRHVACRSPYPTMPNLENPLVSFV